MDEFKMTYSDKAKREGFVALDAGDVEYHAPASEYEKIHEAYIGGKAFVETVTMYNERHTVKLARVAAITLLTPQSVKEREDFQNTLKFAED